MTSATCLRLSLMILAFTAACAPSTGVEPAAVPTEASEVPNVSVRNPDEARGDLEVRPEPYQLAVDETGSRSALPVEGYAAIQTLPASSRLVLNQGGAYTLATSLSNGQYVQADAESQEVFLVDINGGKTAQISDDGRHKWGAILSEESSAWLAEEGELSVQVEGREQILSMQLVYIFDRVLGALGIPLSGCGNCPENRFDIYLADFTTYVAGLSVLP